MARTSNSSRLNLQDAVALLIRNQAAFVTEMAEINRRHNELAAETKQMIAASYQKVAEIDRTLSGLPEAIRQDRFQNQVESRDQFLINNWRTKMPLAIHTKIGPYEKGALPLAWDLFTDAISVRQITGFLLGRRERL